MSDVFVAGLATVQTRLNSLSEVLRLQLLFGINPIDGSLIQFLKFLVKLFFQIFETSPKIILLLLHLSAARTAAFASNLESIE